MNLFQNLYTTYGKIEEYQKDNLNPDNVLLKPFHSKRNGHICISISLNGDFVDAELLPRKIILPTTNSSENRSNGQAPHPLCDNLQYLSSKYNKESYFEHYVNGLKEWCDSEFSVPENKAVLKYIISDTIGDDLLRLGICSLDENGIFDTSKDAQASILEILPNSEQCKALVYWKIIDANFDQNESYVHNMEHVQNSWIEYSKSKLNKKSICFISGKEDYVSDLMPKNIRGSWDGSKLISFNDKSSYSFRGRFSKDNVCSLSIDAVEKSHKALQWLIANQGFSLQGDFTSVLWSSNLENNINLLEQGDNPDDDPFSLLFSTPDAEEFEAVDNTIDIGRAIAEKFNKYISGRFNKDIHNFNIDETISVANFSCYTNDKGRLSITYYRNFFLQDYFDRLKSWYVNAAYYNRYKGKVYYCTPSLYTMFTSIYGEKAKDKNKLKANFYQKIYPSILEGKPLPNDIVSLAIQRASSEYGENKDNCIWVASCLYKYQKYIMEKNKMNKESIENDPSYLFGRLLAIADQVEYFAAKDKNGSAIAKTTNAKRLWKSFYSNPGKIYPLLDAKTKVYFEKLKKSSPGFAFSREKDWEEIISKLGSNIVRSQTLSGAYLLGYVEQKNKKKNTEQDTESSEEVLDN